MSNELTRRPGFMPRTFDEIKTFAHIAARTELVPKSFQGKPDAIFVAAQMGAELGLTPMQSLQNIAVINGRAALWGDAVLALVTSHRDCEDITETFDEAKMSATCTIKRRGRTPIVSTFSEQDAQRAGLWGKAGPWTQYPKRMLQMRARGFAARDAFPDALRGLVTVEEAGDTPETQGRFEAAAADTGAPLPTAVEVIEQPKAPAPAQDGEPTAYEKYTIEIGEAQTAAHLDVILGRSTADQALSPDAREKVVKALDLKRLTVKS